MHETRFRNDVSWRGGRHRRRRYARRAHQAARQADDAPRGDDRPRRLRRPVRAAGPLQGTAARVVHRRRGHQAEAGVPHRPPRHGRHRPGGDERQRHGRLRRRAAAVPRLLRVRQAGRGHGRARDRGDRRRLPGRRAARWSAARPPSCPGSTPTANTTWPASRSASSRRAAASTGARSAPAIDCWGSRRRGFTRTGTRWCGACSSITCSCRWTRRRPG